MKICCTLFKLFQLVSSCSPPSLPCRELIPSSIADSSALYSYIIDNYYDRHLLATQHQLFLQPTQSDLSTPGPCEIALHTFPGCFNCKAEVRESTRLQIDCFVLIACSLSLSLPVSVFGAVFLYQVSGELKAFVRNERLESHPVSLYEPLLYESTSPRPRESLFSVHTTSPVTTRYTTIPDHFFCCPTNIL